MTNEKKPEHNKPQNKPTEAPKATTAPKTVGGHQPAGAKPAHTTGTPVQSPKHPVKPATPAKK